MALFGIGEKAELARQRKAVVARLEADPDAQRLESDHPDAAKAAIFAYQNFLPEDDCRLLIRAIDASAEPSLLFEGNTDPEFRTSYSTNLSRFDPEIQRIDLRLCGLMGLSPDRSETLQGQRYDVGQQFKPHYDYFHFSEPYWHREKKRGGQRSWTAMIYLNTPEQGGETGFPMLGFTVPPRPGMLLMWCNMDDSGAPDLATLHSGEPVAKGRKYIVTKWFRRGKWL